MGQVRRLTEDDGIGMTDDPTGQRLRVRVRREVVAFLADLANAARADLGPGLVAFNSSLNYPTGSIGAAVKTILMGGGGGGGPIDPGVLVAALTGLLGPDQLTTTLRSRIDTIDQPGGLTAQVAALTTTFGSTAAAATSAANAATSATNAAAAQAAAVAANNAAAVSAGNALTSATSADAARVTAETASGSAATSATQAATSATSASGSAATASTEAITAATAAAGASGSATAAATSAGSASSSATAAATSATVAEQRRLDAQTFAGAALVSANSAATSASTAQGSVVSASSQAGLAATARGDAENASTSAATAAASAAVSATNAANSEATASTQASLAATSANAAGNSATAASGSASSAATAATAAGTAASAAVSAKVSAETAASSASVSSGSAATAATQASGSAAAAAASYSSTVAATGSLTAQVNTLQTAVAGPDGLSAQQVLKVSATRSDGKKVYGAVGVAASAVGDAGESQILLDASKILLVPGSDLNASPTNMMVLGLVDGVATLIVPAARIGDATIGTLKVLANAFTDVVSTVVEFDDYAFPNPHGVQDRIFAFKEVANTTTGPFSIEVTLSAYRKLTTPSGMVGTTNLRTFLSIENQTDFVAVPSLQDWTPELISAQGPGVTSPWVRESMAFEVTIPAGKTFRFTPYSRVSPLVGSFGNVSLLTQAFSMRVTSCKR